MGPLKLFLSALICHGRPPYFFRKSSIIWPPFIWMNDNFLIHFLGRLGQTRCVLVGPISLNPKNI